MRQQTLTRRPGWWQLYATLPLMLILLFAQGPLEISASMHEVLEIGIVAFAFVLMGFWVWVNQDEIACEEYEREE